MRLLLSALAVLPFVAVRLSVDAEFDARRTASAMTRVRQDPPIIPLTHLLAKPAVLTARLSPDGRSIAAVERTGGAAGTGPTGSDAPGFTAIVVRDSVGRAPRIVWADSARSVGNVQWSRDGRFLLVLHDRGGNEGYHLLRLDPRAVGAAAVDLTPFSGAEVELVALPESRPAVAIVASNHRDPRAADAYEVDIATGASRLVARNPGDVTAWAAGPDGRVTAASAIRATGVFEVRTRGVGGGQWRTVHRSGPADRAALLGVYGSGTRQRVWIRSNAGAAYESIRLLDPQTGAIRARYLSRCGAVDAGTPHVATDGRLLGEQCTAAAPMFSAADSPLDTLVRDRVQRGDTARAVEMESVSADHRRWLFFTHASTDPGRFVLLDAVTGRATPLFEAHPALAGARLAASEYHPFTARDGLRLSLLLTRSPVGPAGPQPTVIVVHGGPWTREALGYSGETQLLANRGYAVLQVNFRGSTGLGRAVVDGAVGEFGRRMSDDLLDALAWGVRESAVDPTRVCIVGGSYGGYAALVGVTRDAPHFRCGASYAGPVDLETLIRAFPPSWGPFLPRSWYRFVGRPDRPADLTRMRAASPLFHLDAARAPLLLFQGANDPRVRADQTLRVVQGWRARGLPATLLYAGNEGHSFNEETTALAVNRALEEFLAASLGGRVETPAARHVADAIARLTAAGEAFVKAGTPAPRR